VEFSANKAATTASFSSEKADGGSPRGKCRGVVGSGGFEGFDVRKGHDAFYFFFSYNKGRFEEKFLFVLDFCQKKKGVEEEAHKTSSPEIHHRFQVAKIAIFERRYIFQGPSFLVSALNFGERKFWLGIHFWG